MFSDAYRSAWQGAAELGRQRSSQLPAHSITASALIPVLYADEFGRGGALDEEVLARSAAVKRGLFADRVFVIVPIYVTSICSEHCVYCNFRGGNKGIGVERKRLTDNELRQEASYLIQEKGLRVLELVYATDPRVRVDAMCRHIELLRTLLEEAGGGMVAINAEALSESEYRQLSGAGLSLCLLWQETYDQARYALLHPARTRKSDFEYRLNAYERMLSAGIKYIGLGVLSGLADWRRDWAMLMLHEEYLQRQAGIVTAALGIPRLKFAPGALMQDSPFIPTPQEFLAVLGLHNVFSPQTAAFVSTREDWELCIRQATGGGCLFTLNCSTTPGGYALRTGGSQFTTHSYDAPVYVPKLRAAGLQPVFNWDFPLARRVISTAA